MSTVVVLNGTSSSGKTSIARAFQNAAPGVFLNFSIDNILYALPPVALDRVKTGADISDLRLPELVRAFYACVRQLLDLGHDLVIDHAVTARYHADALIEAAGSHRVLLVGLDCPPEVLAERERGRGDRRPGLALDQQARIHSLLEYDVRIDTSIVSVDEAARQIVSALARGDGTAFAKVKARLGAQT